MTDTPALLRAAIDRDYDGKQRRFALAHGIPAVNISDCLRGRPMSPRRLNPIRRALGLPDVTARPRHVVIDAERERVVAKPGHGRKRRTARLTITASHEEKLLWRALAREAGQSLSEFVRENLRPSSLFGM